MGKITYRTAGVDIENADRFVKGIGNMLYKDKLSKVAAFGCLFDLCGVIKKYKNPVLVSSTDGVGTKLKIAQSLNIHNTVGIDLVAMNVNDVVCMGACPLFFLDYIACGKVQPIVLKEVVTGINKGMKQSGCVLLGGETAEMPGMYEADEYDLAGFCVGIADKDKIINGKNIREGDLIIGLESNGLHSNGFSLVRKALGEEGIKEYGRQLLKPTRIYVKSVLALITALPKAVKGIAHVTGGAFFSKVTKILPASYGMVVNRKAWKVPAIFRVIQEKGNIDDKEMYSVFNMGIGMVVVVDKKSAARVIDCLKKTCRTDIIGVVVKNKEKMELV